ncbi:serine protease [Paraconexibacter sp. AEG42_29]|uniref:serine protease n=1 Tax=Paraconexibacter sp. AEG42_29 TaxID=2997339 RepID=UPI00339D627B
MHQRSLALLGALLAFGACAGTAQAANPPAFAAPATATVHPGVMTFTKGSQCTANFVFYDATTTYIGQAAHCSGTGGATETDGCTAKSLPIGTPVEVGGASKPGRLAYNSWLTMQAAKEKDADTCQNNDFALVALDSADAGSVSPAIPTFGVPTGLNTTGVEAGETVRSYGNSGLRGGIALLSPKTGFSVGQGSGGWSHTVYTLTPGLPGDSGSGFIDARGRAFGILSTLSLLPLPGSNGVSDLSRALAYMGAHGGPAVVLADTSRAAAPVPAAASGPAQAPATKATTTKAKKAAAKAKKAKAKAKAAKAARAKAKRKAAAAKARRAKAAKKKAQPVRG